VQAILQGETLGVDGYILDLRNNPGGVFEEAIAIASFLLDSNDSDPKHLDASDNPVIVETVRNIDPASKRDVVENVFKVGMLPQGMPATAWGLTTRPMVILTNTGTASASEVLTGALQVSGKILFLLFS
jgi:carboxyl-terminal processing protease